ncbi:hypothetical protein Q9L58_006688 [Maublancomyces gigas]|uniref:Cyclin C-terminal domain-containing protein n=1 Tax=Discina gigas TaxID=1032678 RepID=A0ABR3GEH3_9PEZI
MSRYSSRPPFLHPLTYPADSVVVYQATALTFLHRLYLTTSTLTLHPKNILLLILYLATKTENHYTPIESFIATAATAGPVISQEDLLAPEFKVAIGLRWAFQVWHPLRGLEGIFLELNAIAIGRYQSPHGNDSGRSDAKEKLDALLRGDADRIGRAHHDARALLTTTALLTDAYFLYTPAQISFAAFWQADRDMAGLYIDVKFPPAAEPIKVKLLATIVECAGNHLASTITRDSLNPYPGLLLQLPQNGVATSIEAATERALMKEVMRIDKKLYHVTNRDRKVNEKKGAGGENGTTNGNGNGKYEGVDEEKRLKKRRLEREKLDKDGDVFGELL